MKMAINNYSKTFLKGTAHLVFLDLIFAMSNSDGILNYIVKIHYSRKIKNYPIFNSTGKFKF